jgi:hypothetical protein
MSKIGKYLKRVKTDTTPSAFAAMRRACPPLTPRPDDGLPQSLKKPMCLLLNMAVSIPKPPDAAPNSTAFKEPSCIMKKRPYLKSVSSDNIILVNNLFWEEME